MTIVTVNGAARPSGVTATDLFCGGGGSGIGMKRAGVQLVIAANHWDLAIKTHQTNFPDVDHDIANISETDPRRYPRTNLLWASPSCTKHSKAQGIADRQRDSMPGADWKPMPKDAAERSRATMWDVIRFAEYHAYDAIVVENVVEVCQWVLYPAWLAALQQLGYRFREVFLNSMHAGHSNMDPAPQSRDRVYIVAWRKGVKAPNLDPRPPAFCTSCNDTVGSVQHWKNGKTIGKYKQQYIFKCPTCKTNVDPFTLGAVNAIDWSLPGERIGDRSKPLADGTIRRIEAGIARYSVEAAPVTGAIVVPLDRASDPDSKRARTVLEPLGTQTTRQTWALATPPLIAELRGGGSTARPVSDALSTVTASGNHHMLVTPPGFLMRNNGSKGDGGEHCTPFTEPTRTMTTAGHQSVVLGPEAQHLMVPYYRTGVARPVTEPMGTLTTVDRHAVLRAATPVEDCTFRMLEPHEVGAAMAFTEGYTVLGTKRERVRQYGNAVTPPAAQLLAAALIDVLEEAA